MQIKLYIEAREGDTWKGVSRSFCDYLSQKEDLVTFGIVEDDSLEFESLSMRLWGFTMKAEYSSYINHFNSWAKSVDRIHGSAQDRNLSLSNGVDILLPEQQKTEIPSWLKET